MTSDDSHDFHLFLSINLSNLTLYTHDNNPTAMLESTICMHNHLSFGWWPKQKLSGALYCIRCSRKRYCFIFLWYFSNKKKPIFIFSFFLFAKFQFHRRQFRWARPRYRLEKSLKSHAFVYHCNRMTDWWQVLLVWQRICPKSENIHDRPPNRSNQYNDTDTDVHKVCRPSLVSNWTFHRRINSVRCL